MRFRDAPDAPDDPDSYLKATELLDMTKLH